MTLADFIKDSLFRAYAVCCTHMHRPIRIHIKYSTYPVICAHTQALEEEIKKNFETNDVIVTKEKSELLLNNYEIWVVGGKLLWSRRNGQGFVDTDEKREQIVEGIKEALELLACPPNCKCATFCVPCRKPYWGV